jgi:alpha-1,3/alpha-1,6-mannosyltransferase
MLITFDRDKATFVSLNRFEAKKNIELALGAFSLVKKDRPNGSMRLVVAGMSILQTTTLDNSTDVPFCHHYTGGYDKALKDNIDTYARLTKLCDDSGLRYVTIRPEDGNSNPTLTEVNKAEVVFLLNFTDGQRASLLTADSSIALLYTPENEHFGIVPVEAMACGLPVLGVNSGGPTETVVDTDAELSGEGATGLLRRPEADQWSRAMSTLFDLSPDDRARIARAGKERVRKNFSSEKLGEEMELACYEAVSRGRVGLEEQCLLLVGALGLAWIMAAIAVLFSQIPASYFR